MPLGMHAPAAAEPHAGRAAGGGRGAVWMDGWKLLEFGSEDPPPLLGGGGVSIKGLDGYPLPPSFKNQSLQAEDLPPPCMDLRYVFNFICIHLKYLGSRWAV